MKCRNVQKLILDIDAGENPLGGARQPSLQEHLEECPECREFQAQLKTIAGRFESHFQVSEPRPGFAGRMVARIPIAGQRPFDWRKPLVAFLQPAPATVALASLAMGVFLAARMTIGEPQPLQPDLQTLIFAEFFATEPLVAVDQVSSLTFEESRR